MPEYHFAAEQSVLIRELSRGLSAAEDKVTQLSQTVLKLERRAESHRDLIAERRETSGSTAAKKRPNDSPDLAPSPAHKTIKLEEGGRVYEQTTAVHTSAKQTCIEVEAEQSRQHSSVLDDTDSDSPLLLRTANKQLNLIPQLTEWLSDPHLAKSYNPALFELATGLQKLATAANGGTEAKPGWGREIKAEKFTLKEIKKLLLSNRKEANRFGTVLVCDSGQSIKTVTQPANGITRQAANYTDELFEALKITRAKRLKKIAELTLEED